LGFTQKAHDCPINAMVTYNESMLITGDDNGTVKLWDLRKKTCAFEWNENEDYITDFVVGPNTNFVVATSGDGCLSVLHLRKGTLEAMSDNMEDGLLSCTLVKNAQKVAVGMESGVIGLWNWGDWGDLKDRFLGHPDSVDSIVAFTNDLVFTGSSDGFVRACGIHPNRIYSVIGDHDTYPVEDICLSRDRKFLASCSHDNTVKFWYVGNYENFIPPQRTEEEKHREEQTNPDNNSGETSESSEDEQMEIVKPSKKNKTKASIRMANKSVTSSME